MSAAAQRQDSWAEFCHTFTGKTEHRYKMTKGIPKRSRNENEEDQK
jgi:hypothetical protein